MKVKNIKNKADFSAFVEKIQSLPNYKTPLGFGIARLDRGQNNPNKILQASFAMLNWNENHASAALFLGVLMEMKKEVDFSKSELVFDVDKKFVKKAYKGFNPFIGEAKGKDHKNVQVIKHLEDLLNEGILEDNFSIVFIFNDDKPQSVECVYAKLYALSLGKAPLRSLNLNGAFGILENVAWSDGYPIELDWLRENEIALKLDGIYPIIEAVDKFPRYLQHIIPSDNTRILETSKVRMGAHLSAGTTVMPGASYVNFNAGTTGSVMVEGRISSSAVVGEGSDIGGGASILGVLSGTNGNPVSIGKNTLLGANSVTGIPLGDGCIVDAGIAILEGTKITIDESQIEKISAVNPGKNITSLMKAIDLSSCNGVHFRQNSQTGTIVAMRSQREIKLNQDLH